jgi:hypothetical protein
LSTAKVEIELRQIVNKYQLEARNQRFPTVN